MKKLIALLLTLLLLSGCASFSTALISSSGQPETISAAPDTTKLPVDTAAPVTTEAPATLDEPATAERPPETEAPTLVTEAPATETPPEPVDPWTIPDVSYFDEGYYEDDLGNGWTWSYELPRLNADTPGARAINEAIDASFGKDVREARQAMEEKLSLVLYHVGSRWVLWEDVLSLIVIEHTDWGFTNYGVFCYDCSTGQRLDTQALLKRMEVSQQEFLDTCRTQMIQFYKDEFSAIPEEQRAQYGYYDGLERQITSDYVNLELMAYPEENGDIVIIAPIVSLAGADWYYHEIHLGMGGSG